MRTNCIVRRAVSLLLVFVMLVAVGVTGCQKPDVTEPGTTEENASTEASPILENGYVIIRPSGVGMNCLDKIQELKATLDSVTGGDVPVKTDRIKKGETVDDLAYEILIGNTNRPQSSAVLSEVKRYGFVIKKAGNKIVINGSNEMMVEKAIEYLLDKSDFKAGKWFFDETIVQDPFGYYLLGNRSGADFVIRRPVEKATEYNSLVKNIASASESIFGAEPETRTFDATSNKRYSLYLGKTPSGFETIKKTDATACGIYIADNAIYLCGNTYTSLSESVSRFISLLKNCVMENGDVIVYNQYSVTSAGSEKIYNIPAYEAGGEANIIENNPGYVTHIKNTTIQEYNTYIHFLRSEGYTLYQDSAKKGNSFATLYNDDVMIHAYFLHGSSSVKIIVEPKGAMYQTTPTTIERITTPSVTQLTLDYEHGYNGMTYIVTLSDSTFIVIDGALADSRNYVNATNILNKMKELNKRPDGKIIINAWYISHAHPDHFQALEQFSLKYASQVSLGQIIINTPSARYAAGITTYDPFNSDGNDIAAIMKRFSGNVELYIPHTGQEFFVKNVKFEMLYTYEDFFPNGLVDMNNSCIVSRMTLEGQTILWGGDTYVAGCNIMCGMWGNYLKSDIVQMPHHGYENAGGELWYKYVGASVALWPRNLENIDWNSSQRDTVKNWLSKAGTTEAFIATPDDVTLPLPYQVNTSQSANRYPIS